MEWYEIFDRITRNEINCTFGGDGMMTRSRFGGQPDAPEGFEWPYFSWEEESVSLTMSVGANAAGQECQTACETMRKPLAFLAQFDCAELAAYDSAYELPDHGMLSFFYELDSQRWGFDPKDAGCARVYWFEDADALHPAEFPDDLETDYRMPMLPVTFASCKGLPDFDEFAEEDVSADYDEYAEERVLWGWEPPEEVCSKLLGYADTIQGEMLQECVRVTNGIYCGGVDQGDPDQLAVLRGQEKDWRLLFQLDLVESEGFELMFGDCGRIYFYIRQDDLKNRRFDKVWLILQCY